MNTERIQKLAERAGFSYMPSDYPESADLYKCHDFEIEKFAELIVRECATLVDAAFDIDEHSGEVVSYADGGQLKKHFGVEQ